MLAQPLLSCFCAEAKISSLHESQWSLFLLRPGGRRESQWKDGCGCWISVLTCSDVFFAWFFRVLACDLMSWVPRHQLFARYYKYQFCLCPYVRVKSAAEDWMGWVRRGVRSVWFVPSTPSAFLSRSAPTATSVASAVPAPGCPVNSLEGSLPWPRNGRYL